MKIKILQNKVLITVKAIW